MNLKVDRILFERLLLVLLAGLGLFASAATISFMVRSHMPWFSYLLAALLLGLFVLAAWRGESVLRNLTPLPPFPKQEGGMPRSKQSFPDDARHRLREGGMLRSEQFFLVACLVFFLLSRLAWIALTPTQPVSDFAVYEDLARKIAAAAPLDELYAEAYPMQLYSLGYPGILAIFYNLTGSGLSSTSEALGNVLLAKWVNLLFGLASLALIYAIARQLSTARAARLAAVLFALWPAQLAFSSVLASEHLATLLALAGLAAAYPALKSDHIPAPAAGARLIAAGVCFALGAATRNTNLIILLAVLIALLFSPLKQPLFKHKLAAAGLLLVAFASMTWLYREAIHARVRVYPTSTTAFSLLVGANYESGGLWNYADYDLMSQHPNIEVAKEFAWDEALRRITGQPARFLQLTISKVAVLWQDDGYSIFWSTQKLSPERSPEETQALIRQFTNLSQPFHAAVWILSTAAAFILLRRPTGRMNIIAMTLLGSTLMHSILEVQNRYAYWMMPLLFILAAVGWAEFFQREPLSDMQANQTGPAPVNSLAASPEPEERTPLRD